MEFRRVEMTLLLFVLASLTLGLYLYPNLPENLASHWNVQGEVDGYLPRTWGVLLVPLASVGLWLLFLVLPRIDPRRENIEQFRRYFDATIFLVFAFLLYLHLFSLAWNLGLQFPIGRVLAPAFGVLLYNLGVLVAHAWPNWSVGIRTPWTLSSESVWQKTHRLGGWLFKAASLLAFLGFFFPRAAFWLVLVPVVLVTLATLIYSYCEYQREEKNRPLGFRFKP